jgi:hypothetical protein
MAGLLGWRRRGDATAYYVGVSDVSDAKDYASLVTSGVVIVGAT